MKMPEPRRMFQFIGLTACVVVGTPVLVDFIFQLPLELAKYPALAFGRRQQVALVVMAALPAICLLGFAGAFWATTELGARGGRIPKPALLLLLILQVLLALLISADLLYIVAAEAPFVLPDTRGLIWLGGQCVASAVFALFAASTGHFSPADGLTHTPYGLVVPITILDVIAWIVFAFGIGYLVVRAETGRLQLARTNSELVATELLLADSARMGERLRISRELHDTMGHRLAALNIHLELASRLDSGPSAEAVKEAHTAARLLLAEVREVVGELREKRETNLKGAIEILARGVARPQIYLALADDLDALDPFRAHALFRCVQETITNAIKHSGASNLWIEVDHNTSRWRLCVRDNGRGAKTMEVGNGLRGIRERIEEMGGTMEIETRMDEGFYLFGTIPVAESFA